MRLRMYGINDLILKSRKWDKSEPNNFERERMLISIKEPMSSTQIRKRKKNKLQKVSRKKK